MDDVKQTSYCTVLDKSSQTKYLCYTRRKTGTFSISLTDAADVWSTELTTEDSLQQFRHRFVLKSPEEYVLQLRSACVNGDVSVLVKDSSVQLQGLTLNRLKGQQATHELKRLLFTMAESLPHTHSTCM